MGSAGWFDAFLVAPFLFGGGFLVVEPVEAFLWAGGVQVGGELRTFDAALSQVHGCLLEVGLVEVRRAGLDGLVEVVGVGPHPGGVQVRERIEDRLAGPDADRGGVLLGRVGGELCCPVGVELGDGLLGRGEPRGIAGGDVGGRLQPVRDSGLLVGELGRDWCSFRAPCCAW